MEGQTNVNTFVGITWVLMSFITLGVVMLYLRYWKKISQKNREKEQEALKAAFEAEERQKQRIAANLHDEVIALISGVIHGIDASIRDYSEGRFNIEGLERSKMIAVELEDSIRSVSLELMPALLIDEGLASALNKHLENMNLSGCSIKFVNKTPFDNELPFEKNVEVQIYRICLEILNNLKKHDNFSQLEVVMSTTANILSIAFKHNGKGITNEQIRPFSNTLIGLGLKSMYSRLSILNGKIDYTVNPEIAPSDLRATIELKAPFTL